MDKEINYVKDIHIDETQLDVEWCDQAELYLKYARYEVQCEKEYELKKMQLDLLHGELDEQVRKHPEDFNLEGIKLVNDVVNNTVISLGEYQDMYIELLDAKVKLGDAKVATKAFLQRKEALENLVYLNGQQYFAGPKLPRNLSEERQIQQKKVNTKVGRRLKRRIKTSENE